MSRHTYQQKKKKKNDVPPCFGRKYITSKLDQNYFDRKCHFKNQINI